MFVGNYSVKDTKRKCTAECNSCWRNPLCKLPRPQTSVLVGYKSKAQYYEPPNESRRNVIHLSPISAIDLMNLTNLEIGMIQLLCCHSCLAKDFEVVGTDAAHELKLLALELNPTIPGLEIKPKRKSIRKKFEGTSISMPVPPKKFERDQCFSCRKRSFRYWNSLK